MGDKMAKKLWGLFFCFLFLLGFISGGRQILWCTTGKAWAQASDQKILSAQMKELELKIKTIENNYIELKKENIALKQDISNNKVDSLASKKLLEVSEKNLTAPTWVTGVLIGLIIALSGIISITIFVLRRGILDKIESEINKINEARDSYTRDFKSQIDSINEKWESHKKDSCEKWESYKIELDIIKKEVLRLLAYGFNASMVDEWKASRFDQAIYFGESAVKYGVEVFGEKSEVLGDRLVLERIRSNLAYLYAERNRTDKAQQAIDYARKALKIGQDNGDLDLIDNFLFVIKIFSRNPDDRRLWKKVYLEYKDKIYNSGIRIEEEQKEFDNFYKELG